MITSVPRPEYPRPQFVRDNWKNLNGTWEFEIDQSRSGMEKGYADPKHHLSGSITVPFCPESALSGVAYKTGTEQNVNLVLSTIREARKKEKVTAELQLHSDQGFQYTSQAYFKLTQSYGITPSMSRRGNPYDNALAENFFSILKTECIYRTKLKTYEEARLLIDEYIYFYNYQRIQLKTKLTPMEYRSQFVA